MLRELITQFGLAKAWLLIASFNFGRYLVLAGLAYGLVYWFFRQRWQVFKIQPKLPERARMWGDVAYSALTGLVFGGYGIAVYFLQKAGYTRIYSQIDEYGWAYLPISLLLMLLLHDTYFYWTHRLMHHKRLFRHIHRVHHLSHNPTPFTALAFHPLEALIEGSVILPIVFIIPAHPVIIATFTLLSMVMNVLGHLGYELFPAKYIDHWLGRWQNTSTHHNMHHKLVKCNYGLYFNFWDRWMGTNHQSYETHYRQVAAKQKQ